MIRFRRIAALGLALLLLTGILCPYDLMMLSARAESAEDAVPVSTAEPAAGEATADHRVEPEVTLTASCNETQVLVKGTLSAEAELTLLPAKTPEDLAAEAALSFELTLSGGSQPEEGQGVELTLRDPSIRKMLQDGLQVLILQTAEDGTLLPIKPLSAAEDTVVCRTERIAPFTVAGFATETLLTWASGSYELSLVGIRGVTADCAQAPVQADFGVEVLDAWELRVSGPLSEASDYHVVVRTENALRLPARECVAFCPVRSGKADVAQAKEVRSEAQIPLEGAGGAFALIHDSGLREQRLEAQAVDLSGLIPKNATLRVSDAMSRAASTGLNGTVLAAYDISILENGAEFQPDAEHPIEVSIAVDEKAAANAHDLQLWHVRDNGGMEQITAFTLEGGTIRFSANGFSVYVVIGHEEGTVVTPRVMFHFIDQEVQSVTETVGETSTVYYVGDPYLFVNKGDDPYNKQSTQVLKNGETLELIDDPLVSTLGEFYGWYCVAPYQISGTTDAYGIGTADAKLYYTWPEMPDAISFEKPISITEQSVSIGSTVHWSLDGVTGEGTVDSDGNVHVFLAPVYEKYHFVSFMLFPRGSSTNNVMARKLIAMGSASSLDLKISDIYSASHDPEHLVFTGWEYEAAENDWAQYPTVDYFGAPICDEGKDGVYLTVSEEAAQQDIILYPLFVEARWTDYTSGVSGDGATYVASRYLKAWGRATTESTPLTDGETVFATMAEPTRKGYHFDGWYAFAETDENGNITNLNEAADVAVSYLTLDGNNYSKHTVTVHTRAIQITNGGQVCDNGSPYSLYVKDLGGGSGELTTTAEEGAYRLFEVVDDGGTLKMKLHESLDRLKLQAKWSPSNSKITVVYWTENLDGSYSPSATKEITTQELTSHLSSPYTAESTVTLDDLIAYEAEPGISVISNKYLDDVGAVPKAPSPVAGETVMTEGEFKPEGDGIFYDQLSPDQVAYTDESGTEFRTDGSVTIKGDGSSSFNVYYKRKVFTLVFHIGRDGYVKISGPQKNHEYTYTDDPSWDGNWIEFMYNDDKIRELGYQPGIPPRKGQSYEGTFSITYQSRTYDSTYVTDTDNVMGDYLPDPENVENDRNVYTITAKYGAYIGDQWPAHSNPNITFSEDSKRTFYTWAAYYGSRYAYVANMRDTLPGGDQMGNNPDVNGVYRYMSRELCANRAGSDVINENLVHHLVAYFGVKSNAARYKNYHVLFEAVDGTYDPSEEIVEGNGFLLDKYEMTTWTKNNTDEQKTEIKGKHFYEESGSPYEVISNLAPDYQLGWDIEGYNLVYSCYEKNASPSQSNPYHVYFFYRPKQYQLTFMYEDEPVVQSYYYKQSLEHAKDACPDPVKEGYVFRGWYLNEGGVGEPFDFNTTMPNSSIVLYPRMDVLQYMVKIDPNGGIIDHHKNASQATYFTADYGTPVGEYLIEREHILLTPEEQDPENSERYYDPSVPGQDWYYYVNTQYIGPDENGVPGPDGDWGYPVALRNAVFLTESELTDYYNEVYCAEVAAANAEVPIWYTNIRELTLEEFRAAFVSGPYRKTKTGEKYTFMGWYQVREDGSVDTMPFNFNDPVSGLLELRAKWRLDGGYYIQYNPTYYAEDGETVTEVLGDLEDDRWTDPYDCNTELYADQSITHMMRAPSKVTSGWIFRGWRVVRAMGMKSYTDTHGEEHSYTDWSPILDAHGNVLYYQPGDRFTVDSDLVSQWTENAGVIHVQAYYEPVATSYRRPEVTQLILDANMGYSGYLNTGDSSALPPLGGSGHQWINTQSELDGSDHPTQILFGDLQSNVSLHLYRYATAKTHGGVTGTNFFVNDDKFFLLGFDQGSDAALAYDSDTPTGLRSGSAYIPSFSADSVIAVTRDPQDPPITLYAVWEPMVYVTFHNATEGPITIDLSHTGTNVIRVVNEVTGEYDREEAATTVTLEADEQIKLVLPFGENESITAKVRNEHVGKKISVSGVFGSEDPYGSGDSHVPYGGELSYTGNMHIDRTGMIVTYTEAPDQQVDFVVNGGIWTETAEIFTPSGEGIYSIDSSDIMDSAYKPANPSRAGKVFIGWTKFWDIAKETNFSATTATVFGEGDEPIIIDPPAGSSLLDVVRSEYLWDFTQAPPYDETLYAVWSDAVTVIFDLTRSGNTLHQWTGPDTTTVPGAYVFYRASDSSPTVTYTLLPGERVPMPEDPTAGGSGTSNWYFFRWLKIDANINSAPAIIDKDASGSAFDFGQPVSEDMTLYTSWMSNKPQVFSFTIQNNVDGGNTEDVFDYTIAVTGELVRGKITSGTIENGEPSEKWGSISTKLKNNQQYTVIVTVNKIFNNSWNPKSNYSVRIDVIDRDGIVIKSGYVTHAKKQNLVNFVSDYKYTLTITQAEKDGYETSLTTESLIGTVAVLDGEQLTDDDARSFTFKSSNRETTGTNGAVFSPEVNRYTPGSNSLTVVFTNTAEAVAAPTGVRHDPRPYGLLMSVGFVLAAAAFLLRYRFHTEPEPPEGRPGRFLPSERRQSRKGSGPPGIRQRASSPRRARSGAPPRTARSVSPPGTARQPAPPDRRAFSPVFIDELNLDNYI